MKRLLALTAAVACISLTAGAVAFAGDSAPLKGEGKNLKIVANIPYGGGTDMEFMTYKGRELAFVGSAPGVGGEQTGAVRVIDVTNPMKPKVRATLECGLYQADIQISHDKKTLIVGADSAGGPGSCLAVGKLGFMTVDISNPFKPKAIGFAEIPTGSHNITAHPTKPFVYNSNSERTRADIDIWSIKNPRKPKLVTNYATLPTSPHDISFNTKGTRAVTAARTHFEILDTTNPAAPKLLFTGQCPGCTLTHDAKFTPNEKYIVIGDEANGGGAFACPGGALYFFELGGTEAQPTAVLVGAYEPGEPVFARDGQTSLGSCTSHVFDISDDSKRLAISWYSAGTRYLDISNPTGVTVGENATGGIKEIGYFLPEGGVTWSSKLHKGPYIYSNDEFRGFDVFKILKK